MALPDKALDLTIDPDALTLDDIELFEDGGFSVRRFKKFLAAHSNWTPDEIGKLTITEFKTVAAQLGDGLKALSVPKANSAV